jgi:hypothetical protein
VQIFVTFPLDQVAEVFTNGASVRLQSDALQPSGAPLEDLGALVVDEVRYEQFSADLWNLEPERRACTLATEAEATVSCSVTDVVAGALEAGADQVQFRIRFEETSNRNGAGDLARFFRDDPNGNEPGIFQLAVSSGDAAEGTAAGRGTLEDTALELPLRVFIIDDADGARSSSRTEIERIFDRVREIWAPAGIGFDLIAVERLEVESAALDALARGDLGGFAASVPEAVEASTTSLVGFYASDIGVPNGVTPTGTTAFFVTDDPSVHDERVSSHEIGHILGLQHVAPLDRLMASGVNGMQLVDDEIATARSTAETILDFF